MGVLTHPVTLRCSAHINITEIQMCFAVRISQAATLPVLALSVRVGMFQERAQKLATCRTTSLTRKKITGDRSGEQLESPGCGACPWYQHSGGWGRKTAASLKPAWVTEQVSGQTGLQSKTTSRTLLPPNRTKQNPAWIREEVKKSCLPLAEQLLAIDGFGRGNICFLWGRTPWEATHAPQGGCTPMLILAVLSGLSGFHKNKEHKNLRGKSDGGRWGRREWGVDLIRTPYMRVWNSQII